jgi:serine/threonine protein kinase
MEPKNPNAKPGASAEPADETRLAESDDSSRPTSASSPRVKSGTSSSGWLSSSDSIDHGRFGPGTLLGGRYRIVGRLGRGGMGEVYRADDLKLGQPVALKFLPPDVDRDPARLTQLHTEVRMARQVSHPNVCRVYDIDEVDGHTFLSMEYVDGEDLASLLKRVGRFPEERALEIARQLCAGLAAAHERGVVHRDLKPANVMLDASGKVRVTDFGLAGIAGEAIRAGTPAYMAPEQLAGNEVTARSDIYSLGLVLYELFTGHRALEGKTLAELIRMREESGIVPPSALVKDLNPEIERAILQCVWPEVQDRPASALAVSAMLPGGDPLAAALAAGETPSPEMVAAAGGTNVVSTRTALAAASFIAVSLAVITVLYQHVMMINRVPTPKTPEALQDRAIEALTRLGYTDPPAATASGLGLSLDYARFIESTTTEPNRWKKLATERPEAFYLWYRTSPRALVPLSLTSPVSGQNPPNTVGDMTLILVDASGRLGELIVVPQPLEHELQEIPRVGPDQKVVTTRSPIAWNALFEAAGLSMSSFQPATPQIRPPVFADERAAWEGRLPELPEHTFRVEAAAVAGKPVYFAIVGPWSRSSRARLAPMPLFNIITSSMEALLIPALMLAGAVLARRNVKLGRGDRQGAFTAATVVFAATMTSWLLGRHVMPLGIDIQRMFASIGVALFDAATMWLTYLGLEPYVRRHAPDSLIGWTRLISGQWRNPRVGTDVMVGVAAGLAMTVLYAAHNILPVVVGRPEPMPLTMDPNLLGGTREVLSYLLNRIATALQSAMLCVVGLVALALWLKRTWLAALAAVVVFTPVAVNGMFPAGTPILDLTVGAALIVVFVLTIVRFGLLATIAALTTHFVLIRAPLTLNLSSWRGPTALWFLGTVALMGFGAVYIARYGKWKIG